MLLPIAYYKTFIETVERINNNLGAQRLNIRYGLQTNGTRVTPEWCRFFREYDIEVGLSCDGPAFLHDHYRRHWNGAGSHHEVQKAIQMLRVEGIPIDLLTTVTPETLQYPEEFFHFLIANDVQSVGLNFVRKIGAHETEYLEAHLAQCQSFIQHLYRLYSAHRLLHPERHLQIREFDRMITLLTQPDAPVRPDSLTAPFKTVSIDRNGNLSTFDPQLLSTRNHHHPDGDFLFGNLLTDDIEDIIRNAKLQQVHEEIQAGIALCREKCDYFDVCYASLPAEKYCENGTFNSAECVQCEITKKLIGHTVLDDFHARLAEEKEGYELTRRAILSAKPAPPQLPLIPGVQIVPHIQTVIDESFSPVSLLLSNGTDIESGPIPQTAIHVPKTPWRQPSAEELDMLLAQNEATSKPSIGIWQLPTSLYQQIHQAIAGIPSATKESLQTDLNILQGIDTIRAHVVNSFNAKAWLHELYTVGVERHAPELPTVNSLQTSLQSSGGLHVDHWDKQPPYFSDKARNRLVINVGSESWAFLYVNPMLTQLLDYIGDTDITPEFLENPTRIGQAFMRKYPNYPVVRLLIKPGQAYIAPTDALIHDVATESKQATDYSLTFLGRFSPDPLKTFKPFAVNRETAWT